MHDVPAQDPAMSEESTFDVWFEDLRTSRWRAIRPDMGLTPSPGYMLGLRAGMLTGWLAWAAIDSVKPSYPDVHTML
jgi:hypothetical protein